MMVEPYTKTELERRRLYPLTEGAHTVLELAKLIQQGQTYRQIAALWGMRPVAGKDDLRHDTWDAWERAGSPGGIPHPEDGHRWDSPAWNHWRAVRDTAVASWLTSMAPDSSAPRHCSTCTCA